MAVDVRVRGAVLLDPTVAPYEAEFAFAPRIQDLTGKRVGLLDNSKANSDKFLDEVLAILDARYHFADVVRMRKPTASRPVPEDMLEELKRRCDVVITAVGD